MIVITLKKKQRRIIRIKGRGHASEGGEELRRQICAAVSILFRTLAIEVGQVDMLDFGKSNLQIPSSAQRAADFAIRGLEYLSDIYPENVRIRMEYVL